MCYRDRFSFQLQRTFESYEEKFKGITSPNLSASLDTSASTSMEDVSSPTSSRVKRRHAEPSIMADFVTSLPGKKSRKQIGDGDSKYNFMESE